MEIQEYIEHVLRQAEEKLAVRLKEAVKDRQYAAVAELASTLERVQDLVQSAEIAERRNHQPEIAFSADRNRDGWRIAKARTSTGSSSSGPERRTGRQYPRFLRSENRLVKVGWSKKNGAEYEHRASRATVEAVVAALREMEPHDFSMKQLMHDAGVTSYQVHLIAAWLRSVNAVRRAGRGRYAAVSGRLSNAAIERHWQSLEDDASPEGDSDE